MVVRNEPRRTNASGFRRRMARARAPTHGRHAARRYDFSRPPKLSSQWTVPMCPRTGSGAGSFMRTACGTRLAVPRSTGPLLNGPLRPSPVPSLALAPRHSLRRLAARVAHAPPWDQLPFAARGTGTPRPGPGARMPPTADAMPRVGKVQPVVDRRRAGVLKAVRGALTVRRRGWGSPGSPPPLGVVAVAGQGQDDRPRRGVEGRPRENHAGQVGREAPRKQLNGSVPAAERGDSGRFVRLATLYVTWVAGLMGQRATVFKTVAFVHSANPP